MPGSSAVLRPNLGLTYNQPVEALPPTALVDGNNFRVKQGVIDTRLMGRSKFRPNALPGPVALIDNFLLSTGQSLLIYATITDLFNDNNATPVYLTPIYATGTVAVTNGSKNVTGTGTSWATSIGSSSPRNNVRPGDFIFVGSATQNATSPVGGWWQVATVTDNTHLTLVNNYTGTTASGQAYTARQCFGGTLDDPWSTEYFPNADDSGGSPIGDQWIAVNGQDPVVTWNGVAQFASYQPSLGFTAKSVWRYKDQLLYINIVNNSGTEQTTAMANSNAGQPYNVSTGIANISVVTDGNYPIIAAGRLYDQLVLYAQSTVTGGAIGGEIILATFVGGTLGYTFRTVITGRAPLAMNLVADFGYYHKFLGYEGEWQFNGIGLMYIGGHIWRQVSPSIDLARINRSYCYFDEAQGELIWAVTYITDTAKQGPEVAFVEHYLEDDLPQGWECFSKRDFKATATSAFLAAQAAVTWNTLTNAWNTYNIRFNSNLLSSNAPLTLVGDANGNILQLSTQDTDFDGSTLTEFVTFPPRVLVDERHNGMIRRVYPFTQQATGSLTVTASVYDRVEGDTATHAILSYDLTQSGQRFVNPFISGRLGQVQFGTTGSVPFVLAGYDWDVVPGGMV